MVSCVETSEPSGGLNEELKTYLSFCSVPASVRKLNLVFAFPRYALMSD